MPRRPSPRSVLLKSWIERVDEKAFSTNGKIIYCEVCQCDLHVKKYTHLQQHSTSSKHSKRLTGWAGLDSDNSSTESRHNDSGSDDPDELKFSKTTGSFVQMDSKPSTPCCANCTRACERRSADILAELSFDQHCDNWSSKLNAEKPVTILEALGIIFGFTFYSDETDVLKDRLILCSTCEEHLANLYRLFCEFKDLCHEESYISTNGIQRPLDMGSAIPGMQTQDSVASLKIKEKSLKSRLKALKKRQNLRPQTHRKSENSKIKIEMGNVEPSAVLSDKIMTTRTRPKIRQERPWVDDAESDGADNFEDPRDFLDLEYTTDTDKIAEPNLASEKHVLKRPRGRPRKENSDSEKADFPKRSRGRPRKEISEFANPAFPKRARGRPRKENSQTNNIFNEGSPKDKQTRKSTKKEYKCLLCGKVARSNWNLQLHIRGVHEGYRRYQCATCKKYYANKSFLLNHVSVMHNREANQFICTEPGCGRAFAYPAGLRVHKLTHSGVTKFSCDVCHKRFRRGCDMNDHKRKHTTEKPFICEHCGCCFKSRHNLTKHGVIHDEQGRFKGKPAPTCTICNKTFLGDWNLRLHIRTVHEKLTPYKCPLCVKAFSSSSNLKVHLYGFHKCPRDANNKIILPTLPISHDGIWSNDAIIKNPIPPAEKDQVRDSKSFEIRPSPAQMHSQNQVQISPEVAPQPKATTVSVSSSSTTPPFSHAMTSYFNYT